LSQSGESVDLHCDKFRPALCPWRVGALTVARIASMGTKPWRAMDEYKFLQTICEDSRPADCVPFINRCPSCALQCPESRVPHPLQFMPPFLQIENDLLFFGVA